MVPVNVIQSTHDFNNPLPLTLPPDPLASLTPTTDESYSSLSSMTKFFSVARLSRQQLHDLHEFLQVNKQLGASILHEKLELSPLLHHTTVGTGCKQLWPRATGPTLLPRRYSSSTVVTYRSRPSLLWSVAAMGTVT
jgi:hypothetical protein